jgi:hypothetical protein
MLILLYDTHYQVIETADPLVILLDAQPYAMIKYLVDGEEIMEAVS